MTKLIITLLSFGLYLGASAQCQADFTYSATNGTVTFTNTSTGGGLFNNWTFGDGATSYNANPTHTYTTTGNYIVCLSIFDSLSQCQDSYCDTIFVQADSTGGGCNVTSNVYSNANGTIIGTATGASMYNWAVYDNSWNYLYDVYNSNLNYNPGANGNYNVCLTAYDSQQNFCDSSCYVVTIMDSTGGGGCDASAVVTGNLNGTITGTASSSGAYSYYWSVFNSSNTLVHSATTNPMSYNPGIPDVYTVCLTTYDSLQQFCDSTCYLVSTDSTAGMSLEDEFIFNIYPNPTQGVIHLEVSPDQISEIILVDITGSVLLRENIMESTKEIDLSLYPKGMYFIHALGRKGQRLSTSKVLRQ